MRLPASAQEFERVIGRELTLKLSELVKPSKERGGRIYIPSRAMTEDHPIARQIGLDAANKLHKAFGGSLMPLSPCRSAKRHRTIVQGFVKGYDMRELTSSHGCSERTVHRALRTVTTRDLAGMEGIAPPPGLGSFGPGHLRVTRRTADKR